MISFKRGKHPHVIMKAINPEPMFRGFEKTGEIDLHTFLEGRAII